MAQSPIKGMDVQSVKRGNIIMMIEHLEYIFSSNKHKLAACLHYRLKTITHINCYNAQRLAIMSEAFGYLILVVSEHD